MSCGLKRYVAVPEHSEQQRVVDPDYHPSRTYVPRTQRPEWVAHRPAGHAAGTRRWELQTGRLVRRRPGRTRDCGEGWLGRSKADRPSADPGSLSLSRAQRARQRRHGGEISRGVLCRPVVYPIAGQDAPRAFGNPRAEQLERHRRPTFEERRAAASDQWEDGELQLVYETVREQIVP